MDTSRKLYLVRRYHPKTGLAIDQQFTNKRVADRYCRMCSAKGINWQRLEVPKSVTKGSGAVYGIDWPTMFTLFHETLTDNTTKQKGNEQ